MTWVCVYAEKSRTAATSASPGWAGLIWIDSRIVAPTDGTIDQLMAGRLYPFTISHSARPMSTRYLACCGPRTSGSILTAAIGSRIGTDHSQGHFPLNRE